jgi:hypothetical protein
VLDGGRNIAGRKAGIKGVVEKGVVVRPGMRVVVVEPEMRVVGLCLGEYPEWVVRICSS